MPDPSPPGEIGIAKLTLDFGSHVGNAEVRKILTNGEESWELHNDFILLRRDHFRLVSSTLASTGVSPRMTFTRTSSPGFLARRA